MHIGDRALVEVGDVIADRYRIDRVLGKGAMGLVVAATHIELRKPRALKFMLPDSIVGRESVERFLREARAAAELKSQHAVKIHDVARLPTGEPYIVMEFLEGTDFKDLMKDRRVLPVPEAVSYLLQACEAIAEAHAAGIVHRDLKPANLFLARGVGGAPCVKVLDFGIAKLNDPQPPEGALDLTRSHAILGSPLYMSPEQILSTRYVDGRSDIWSLGVTLYSLVTGELPFRGESAHAVFAAVQREPPPPPSIWKRDLPTEVERIILRCLEKEPARRYATVAELAAALAPFAVPGARLTFESAPQSRDLSDTQLPTQVRRSSSGQGSPPSISNLGRQPSFSSSGTQVMDHRSASVPGRSQNDLIAPRAQTNSPMVQSIAATAPAGGGGARGLLLASGGFALALLLIAMAMLVSRSGTHAQPPTAAAPPTAVTTAGPESTAGPVVIPSGVLEPSHGSSPLPSTPPSAAKGSARAAPAPAPTAKAAPTATIAPVTAPTTPLKGAPVRRRDD